MLSKQDKIIPRAAKLTYIYDKNNETIDESVLLYFKAPNSYTGQDVVEFQCHGGVIVASMILEEVLKTKLARLANPGEFTKIAFLNGKIDLTKAEAIGKLIEAKSISAAKMLARHLRGELKDIIDNARDNLIEILAFVEVSIDYAEEDLPKDLVKQIEDKLLAIILQMQMILKSSKQREGLIDGFKVAIIGKPNVGKSSLLNKLLKYDRAIISDIAGTTRDTIEEEIKIGTHLVKFVDTAGIREASDEIEKIGIKRSFDAINSADIIIAMFDGSRVADDEDLSILRLIKDDKNSSKKFIYLLNKSDLASKFDKKLLENPIKYSCKNEQSEVIVELESYLQNKNKDDEIMLTSTRQIQAVSDTLEFLNSSCSKLSERELELFAFYLNESIASLSSITKAYNRTEILDKMFSNFCLGK